MGSVCLRSTLVALGGNLDRFGDGETQPHRASRSLVTQSPKWLAELKA
jgi:hypothetical protein